MAGTKFDCARCGTKNAGGEVLVHFMGRVSPNRSRSVSRLLIDCNVCGDFSLIDFSLAHVDGNYYRGLSSTSSVDPEAVRQTYHKGILVEQFPKPRPISAPKYTPDHVAKTYSDASKALNAGAFEAAGMTFRKVLDLSTKEIGGEHRNLRPRLDELYKAGKLTEGLHVWSHRLALDGNEATHEAPLDEQSAEAAAKELQAYAEMFLRYVFEMPGRVAARIEEAESLDPHSSNKGGVEPKIGGPPELT